MTGYGQMTQSIQPVQPLEKTLLPVPVATKQMKKPALTLLGILALPVRVNRHVQKQVTQEQVPAPVVNNL